MVKFKESTYFGDVYVNPSMIVKVEEASNGRTYIQLVSSPTVLRVEEGIEKVLEAIKQHGSYGGGN